MVEEALTLPSCDNVRGDVLHHGHFLQNRDVHRAMGNQGGRAGDRRSCRLEVIAGKPCQFDFLTDRHLLLLIDAEQGRGGLPLETAEKGCCPDQDWIAGEIEFLGSGSHRDDQAVFAEQGLALSM